MTQRQKPKHGCKTVHRRLLSVVHHFLSPSDILRQGLDWDGNAHGVKTESAAAVVMCGVLWLCGVVVVVVVVVAVVVVVVVVVVVAVVVVVVCVVCGVRCAVCGVRCAVCGVW